MDKKQPQPPSSDTDELEQHSETQAPDDPQPREIGGRAGPEPTRFGDWEKGGRCVDF